MPKVRHVDENDVSIGGTTKQEWWDKRLPYRDGSIYFDMLLEALKYDDSL